MAVDYTPWTNQVTRFNADDMNAPLEELKDSINIELALKSDTGHTHTEAEITDIGTHNHDLNYASITHDHSSDYADITHDHSSDYASITHDHSSDYADITHDHNDSYYTKTELNTSEGGGEVHWDNITNTPTIGSGDGDVVGPATNTANSIPQWDGANSKTLKDGFPVVTTVGNPGLDTNLVTEQGIREALDAIGNEAQLYVVAGSYGTEDDLVPAEKVIFRHRFCEEVDFASDFSGSYMWAETAATAETTFSITKDGIEIGTVVFAASGANAVFNMDYSTTFETGDLLRIVSPVQDTTLAGISWTLKGTR